MLSLKTKLVSFLMPALVLALPLVSSAQTFSGTYFSDITDAIKNVVDALIPILIGLLVVVFAWGIVTYIWGAAQGKEQSKKIMIWGVVGIAVVVSIWGLVGLLQDVFDIDETSTITPPTVQGL